MADPHGSRDNVQGENSTRMKDRVRKIGIVAGAVLFFFAVSIGMKSFSARPADDHPFFFTDGSFLVIGHRGSPQLFPENTLLGFEGALNHGAEVLEMDLHVTRDGYVVVHHDDTVNRTTNGTGPVAVMDLEEIKKLDAAYHWSEDDGYSFPYRGKNIRIPTLEEVFERFPDVRMILEIKPDSLEAADAVLDLIKAHGREESVLLGSFSTRIMEHVRNVIPEAATSASEREAMLMYILSIFRLGAITTPGYEALLVPERSGRLHVTTPGFLRAARSRNLGVYVWTVNDRDSMVRLIQQGVDGIMTDRVDLLLDVAGGSAPDS
jgi:glycerophosphoryl diester phosphodiesterase